MLQKLIDKSVMRLDFIHGLGLGLMFTAPLFAWTFGKFVGLESPADLSATLVTALLMMSMGKKSIKLTINFVLRNLVFILLNVFFVIQLEIIGDTKNVGWTLFGLAYMGVSAIRAPIVYQEKFLSGFFVVALISVIGYFLSNFESISSSIARNRLDRISFENQAYTLAAYSAATLIYVAIFRLLHGAISIVLILALLAGISMITMAGTRSVYGGIALSILFIYFTSKRKHFTSGRNVSTDKYKRWFAILGIFCVVLVVTKIDTISDRVENQFERIVVGFQSFTQESNNEELSAAGRKFQRDYAIHLFLKDPVVGQGIKTYWVDFPLLQIFSDMGLLVGLIYCLFVIVIPLQLVYANYKKNNGGNIDKFVCGLYLLNLPRLFLHGQPYDWTTYIFLVPVLVAGAHYSIKTRLQLRTT